MALAVGNYCLEALLILSIITGQSSLSLLAACRGVCVLCFDVLSTVVMDVELPSYLLWASPVLCYVCATVLPLLSALMGLPKPLRIRALSSVGVSSLHSTVLDHFSFPPVECCFSHCVGLVGVNCNFLAVAAYIHLPNL